MDDTKSSAVTTLSSALAVLGALGCDAMTPVMLTQCLCQDSFGAVSLATALVDGVCQPVAGPTFKLGAMLIVHTACAFSGRINDWDECAGVPPLRNARAQCFSISDGWIKQMGSHVFAAVQDRATAVVYALKPQDAVYHHYIHMSVSPQEGGYTSTYTSIVRWLASCWPLIALAAMIWVDMQMWAWIVLLGWLGWFLVVLSAGPPVQSGHQCDDSCVKRVYLMNDQAVTKSLVEYTVCLEFDDLARRAMPKRRARSRVLRVVGGLLMTIHFPLGLVATCYDDSTGALVWWSAISSLLRDGKLCLIALTETIGPT
ncbi:hypothetical protein BC939DRAFT_498530 [Gamsiella multidivaricata]|uniref:uncharacterized protein n=1 Tax=Gamsiella multidivaricata TaxID=101098 RepID=UPI00221E56FC|nr:uncharacterized protein BC939DRAFT_498530 [Gamsiella multidivaricata]KAI7832453.1 hypothetical protein BC939DRAFT_498530 [Gamsiella multidivaricata]